MSTVTAGSAAPSVADEVLLGIDVGTQGVRALLVDVAGTPIGSGTQALPPGRRASGRHEQDPDQWWAALCSATRQATADLAGRPVTAVSLDSTSGTVVVQRPDGTARGAALMYDDGRAGEQAQRAQHAGAALWASLGYRMQPAWALPKLSWLLDNDRLEPGDQVVHQGDHLGTRLCGHPVATDTSSALKTGYDLVKLRWPNDVLDALGVPVALLPDVVLPGTPIGRVGAAAAQACGIPAGTALLAGMTDGCAAQVASRALRPGSWSSALGTTLVVKGATPELLLDPQGAVYCHRNPDGGWLPGGASSSGAGSIARDLPGRDLDQLSAAAVAAGFPLPGFTYPLVGDGERFPFVAPQAVAVSAAGGGWSGGAADAARLGELMQSVALVERLAYDVLSALGADITGAVTFSGGATRNHTWNQLRCDVLGRPVLLPRSVEAALGAAVVAAAPAGRLAETAERMVAIDTELEPDPGGTERWGEAYRTFCAELVAREWLDAERLPATLRAAVTR